MSGGSVAYHLRPNKAVDREIFFDFLSRLQRAFPIRDYQYISLGGPYMEDFRTAYKYLGVSRFVCIEGDQKVNDRQKFNAPLPGIDFRVTQVGQFIRAYEATGSAIFWLDYTNADRIGQVRDLEILISKVVVGDVVKITFNAEWATFFENTGVRLTLDERKNALVAKLVSDFALPEDEILANCNNAIGQFDTDRCVAQAICSFVKRRSGDAARARALEKIVFQPVMAMRYRDANHQMLTLCAIVLDEDTLDEKLNSSGLSNWEFASLDWTGIREINVPDLSIKEKLFIDGELQWTTGEILQRLGHTLGVSDEKAAASIESYRRLSRYYPVFGRLSV